MKKYEFVAARPIFYPYTKSEYEKAKKDCYAAHYGFYKCVDLEGVDISDAKICITAQNIYRVYINGEMVMQGPRRTAHGYLRVDEIDISNYLLVGKNHIAVELVEYGDGYDSYSNDSTLEDGMLICELVCNGKCVFATGRDETQVQRLDFRVERCERISHCRQAIEIYNLCEGYDAWMVGEGSFAIAAESDIKKSYLYTVLPFPSLYKHTFENIISSGGCYIDRNKNVPISFYEEYDGYFDGLQELAFMDCRRTVDVASTDIKVSKHDGEIIIESERDSYIMMDMGENTVGLLCVELESEGGTFDFVRSEMLDEKGNIPYYFGTVSRVHASRGKVKRVFFEAGLYRYLKIYIRDCRRVRIKDISVLEYSYPDEQKCSFSCSDENANILYDAAKRTLLLNTLDIFMDCPDRERGGWLCDSLWTARAASLMLADHRVEREMLETFLITDPKKFFCGFFSEVYPANKNNYPALAGITTWSFWLMCQLCEYVDRTGDMDLALEFESRVQAFVNGSESFIGRSGMLEDMPFVFVDWSMSNSKMSTRPISTAANALYAYTLIELGRLYKNDEWIRLGNSVRDALKSAIEVTKTDGIAFFDSFRWDVSGKLVARSISTEACIYTALWSELYNKEENGEFMEFVTNNMGTCPIHPRDTDILKSNLFIGLCIRLDLLARMGEYDTMYKDMLDIYMWQIKEGPGTLWENNFLDTSSRCHGFASHAGVHLMRDVVGFAEINKKEGYIKISPHICGLEWAKGSVDIDGEPACVDWRFDGIRFCLDVQIPEKYKKTIILPPEVRTGEIKTEIYFNGKRLT
ncbi:MAG: hypothetical protein E7667_07865 [Ruminococcaceae bacterium]|nr:hypothetical protein [Oscillospiraceae bacterium]